jgi:hypothetical protein
MRLSRVAGTPELSRQVTPEYRSRRGELGAVLVEGHVPQRADYRLGQPGLGVLGLVQPRVQPAPPDANTTSGNALAARASACARQR